MRPLRILQVTPYYEHAWAYGGIPRSVSGLARALARRGHQVTVCTTDACDAHTRLPRAAASERTADGVEVRVFRNLSNMVAYRRQLFVPLGLATFVRRHASEIDIAHIHGCHHVPGAIASRLLRRAGVPYVIAPHGTAPRLERRRLAKYLFDQTIGRGVVAGGSRVLAVSDAERRQLVDLGIDSNSIRVVGNPFDVAEFDRPREVGRFRQRFHLGDRRVVLFLGKLTPRKRVDVLVDAFAALQRPDTVLVIAGNDLGAGPAIRRRIRRRGLESQTILTGLLSGHSRLEALADADLVVYPGRDEVFGLVALEALLCGTPVIVADDSGCGEVIARTGGGSVVAQGDVAALANAMTTMLDGPNQWRTAVSAAAERVRTWYCADVVGELVAQVYHEVMAA